MAGAKRKSHSERKYPITVYITGAQMDKLGGLEKAKEAALNHLNSK